MPRQSKHAKLVSRKITGISCEPSDILASVATDDASAAIWEAAGQQTTVVGFSPRAELIVSDGTLTNRLRDGTIQSQPVVDNDNPLNWILSELQQQLPRSSDRQLFGDGCAIGFTSYDAARYFERLPTLPHGAGEPDIYVLLFDHLVVLDRENNTTNIIAPSAQDIDEIARSIEQAAPARAAKTQIDDPGELDALFSRDEFIQLVTKAQEYIRAGDIFQVVLANQWTIPERHQPLSIYRQLKQHNASPYHFLIRGRNDQQQPISIVGASPEQMLQAIPNGSETTIAMRPVAGTYPRATIAHEDQRLAELLVADEKERAEHVMLVDLERNDIGRVSDIGTVTVSDLFSVESYTHVHHLVSQVSGRLRNDALVTDALRACFPIGTLTGTPKIRAMEIIAELEATPRGAFGGCSFILEPDGRLDSAVAIRMAVCYEHQTSVHAGAGIVADSSPQREYDECCWKAQSVFEALQAG